MCIRDRVRQESNETSGANKNTVAEETSVEAADISLNTYQNSQYCKPAIDLLQAPTRIKSQRMNKDITENVRILEETLENFGVKAHVTQVSRGPSITQYEIQPAPGVKVSRIVNLADDIALSLAATQVRIEAPIPGKAAVGIEVPNEEIAMVSLREVLESPGFQESQTKLTIALGKDIAGNPVSYTHLFGSRVTAGRVLIDGLGIGDVGNIVLRDRKQLSQDGILIVVMTINKEANLLVSGPDIVTRGFVYVRESEELIEVARENVKQVLEKCLEKKNTDWATIKSLVRDNLSRYLYDRTGRRPMIMPIIMEV